ncbi:MAG TPA: hypothetical protein VL944_00990 [Candidatus Acidoferrum sp.]|nr:hypothetical protein [Candidatus Acidoferrum sp.]
MRKSTKLLIIVIIIAIAIPAGLFTYVAHQLQVINNLTVQLHLPPPSVSAYISSVNLLSYNSNKSLIPSVVLEYSTVNVTTIYANVTLFARKPPQQFYVLNTSQDCYGCDNIQQTTQLIAAYLNDYGIPSGSTLPVVDEQDLLSMPSDSVLLILSGIMPSYMFQYNPQINDSPISYLLSRGVDIVYVGRNFSETSEGQIIVPTNNTAIPYYLGWTSKNASSRGNGFYFDNKTFSLISGKDYGPLSYVNYANGSVLVFSNYLDSWGNSSKAAQDIAKALSQQFWITSYTQGNVIITPQARSNSSGIEPLFMEPGFSTKSTLPGVAYGLVRIYTTANYSPTGKGSLYKQLMYTQNLTQNGTITLPSNVLAGSDLPVSIGIVTGSSSQTTISPHISIYYPNMTVVETFPLPSFTASGTFQQISYVQFNLPPGRYIAQVASFYDKQYAAAYFNVPPISVVLQGTNYSTGTFTFLVTSGGLPLSGINYTVRTNGLYPMSGVVANNGTITYKLPSGSSDKGVLTFNISMLSQYFAASTKSPVITLRINNQYIELAAVSILAVIIVTVVKAPNRDEFYIDVPVLRKPHEVPIRIKASELVSAFEKQNVFFKWRYMPLSVTEVRQAIFNNVRYNNMMVSITYNNVELLLAQMVTEGYLLCADNLYAPRGWVTESGHDIEYLATFKKLRVFFVSHAYQANDIDGSDRADIIATLHNERIYIVIYSRTSKFQKVPIFPDAKTYLAFLNSDAVDAFNRYIYSSVSAEAEELRMYISAGQVSILDADNPAGVLT